MTQTKEPKNRITQFILGTRLDHVPAPDTQQFFTYRCVQCQQETATESEYPSDAAIVCNVCAPAVIQQYQREQDTLLAIDSSPEAKVRMLEAAQRLNMPIEQFLNLFFAYRTGKPIQAMHFDKLLKKRKKKR